MFFPLLTQHDPIDTGEGSIDPLGMYIVADALAVRLIPGVRERQKHPRFLTVTAVSLAVTEDFPEDVIASDGHSEPWLVFEWYVVEGFVRTLQNRKALRGLPGLDKAFDALHHNLPISADRYLKTPSVFGMHGIYRRLAHELQLECGGYLGEFGHELLGVWEREQDQPGFYATPDGPGKGMRKLLQDAVQDGLKKGATDRRKNWLGWEWLCQHLYHYDIGQEESRLITRALLDATSVFRKPVLEFLISPDGQKALDQCREQNSERPFHEALYQRADSRLQEILYAILRFERFARLLQDAFEDCLFELTRAKRKSPPAHFVHLTGVRTAAEQTHVAYQDALDAISAFDSTIALEFQQRFGDFAQAQATGDWVVTLLDHHRRVQREKPPQGKAPWFERFDDGSYMIRPAYARDGGGRHDDSYVHFYRTWSLQSFLYDLRMIHG